MSSVKLYPDDAILLVKDIFSQYTEEYISLSVAKALVAAEVDRQYAHGLFRVESYLGQLKSDKINPKAKVKLEQGLGSVLQIDADYGFAYPAFDLAIEKLIPLAKQNGIAIATIFHSTHSGMLSYHVERIADAGYSGLLFVNSPQAIAPWGGYKGVFGTNPIAFGVPVDSADIKGPLVIDLSLSKIARAKIVKGLKNDKEYIDEGIALDKEGKPTVLAREALTGTLLPIGDAKGYALCLLVEILSACFSGSNIGCEASSFWETEGERVNVGHSLIVFNQDNISRGLFTKKLSLLLGYILEQENTRLPGDKRFHYRELAKRDGLSISRDLMDYLNKLKALGHSHS